MIPMNERLVWRALYDADAVFHGQRQACHLEWALIHT